MNIKPIFSFVLALILFSSCNSNQKKGELPYQSGVHKGEVKEVIQTTQYTYLLVNESDAEKWIAIPKKEVNVGDVYFYKDGYEMTNFKSQELGRTFESVYFIDAVGKTADEVIKGPALSGTEPVKADVRKYDIKVPVADGGITIAALFENKATYSGKKVKISGKVVHYNPGIMSKNWIHLQDGTSFSEKFDLTATTGQEVKVGQVITIEGTVELDKDFGAGYFYDVIITDASILEQQ